MTGARASVLSQRVATAVLAVSAALAAATLAAHPVNADIPTGRLLPEVFRGYWLINATATLLFALPGWYLVSRRPEVPFGWLALAAGLGHGLAGVGMEWAVASQLGGFQLPGAWVGVWMFGWGSVVELPVLATAYALFPDGRLARGWERRAALVAIGL